MSSSCLGFGFGGSGSLRALRLYLVCFAATFTGKIFRFSVWGVITVVGITKAWAAEKHQNISICSQPTKT